MLHTSLIVLALLAPQSPAARPWPHQSSDLSPYASLHFGNLENGVRYTWRNHPDPSGEVFVWLHVRCGSAMEAADERGMAHFVEHMCLRRCGDRKSGELKAWAQKLGMEFGPDLNGFTSYGQTTYLLHLYRSDEKLLRECLEVLRDIAVAGKFDDAEVALERGVIDTEEAQRDDAETRTQNEFERHFLAGSLLADRHPIGVKAARDEFTAKQLEAFYRSWYVPSNFTIALAGDMRLNPESILAEVFGSLPAIASPPVPPIEGLTFPSEPLVVQDPRRGTSRIELRRVFERAYTVPTLESVANELPLRLAVSMLSRRLSLVPERAPRDVLAVDCYAIRPQPWSPVEGIGVEISAPNDRFDSAVVTVESAIELATRDGFTAAELVEAKRLHRLWSTIEADRDRTRLSNEKLYCMLEAASDGPDAFDPDAIASRLAPRLDKVKLIECNAALSHLNARAHVQSAVAIRSGDRAEIAKRLEAARLSAAEPRDHDAPEPIATRFAYSSGERTPGKIENTTRNAKEQTTTCLFENGVRVFLRPFPSGRVEVRALTGSGLSTFPPARRWLGYFATPLIADMGLEAHSAPEWRLLVEGRDVRFYCDATPDSTRLGGNCASRDLRLQCEIVAAHLASPGFRSAPLVKAQTTYRDAFDADRRNASAAYWSEFMPRVLAGEEFTAVGLPDDVEKLDVAELKRLLAPELNSGRLDVILWGGFELDEGMQIAAATFGRLKGRSKPSARFESKRSTPPANGLRIEHTLEAGAAESAVFLLFPTKNAFRDEPVHFGRTFLASIFQDRLFRATRDRLGLSYSPDAWNFADPVDGSHAWISADFTLAPGTEDRVAEVALEVAKTLGKDGVTEEEISRLRPTLLESLDNRQWHDVMSAMWHVDDAIGRRERERAIYRGITKDALDVLARDAFDVKKANVAIIHATSGK